MCARCVIVWWLGRGGALAWLRASTHRSRPTRRSTVDDDGAQAAAAQVSAHASQHTHTKNTHNRLFSVVLLRAAGWQWLSYTAHIQYAHTKRAAGRQLPLRDIRWRMACVRVRVPARAHPASRIICMKWSWTRQQPGDPRGDRLRLWKCCSICGAAHTHNAK